MSSEEDDPVSRVTVAVEELYHLRDTFFSENLSDKISALRAQSHAALALLDSIPPEQRKLPLQRAKYEYLRGKILDVFPEHCKEAEDHLSKAVKLNPSLADAWLCLGDCIWKKGDLSAAKNCYTLALSKGRNKRILCQLSMLVRKMGLGTENQAELVEESIKLAREAITLDVKDGNSWYSLGNAFLASFFVSGTWDHGKLQQSLKAYQNAEKDEGMKSNPDLYFNCATVNKYLENYERALTGFEAAALKDPGLKAAEEVEKITYLLNKINNFLGQSTPKRLTSIARSLTSASLNFSYKSGTVDLLLEGTNKGTSIEGKVVVYIKHDNPPPLYYLISDSNATSFVLSVYGVRHDAIKEGDQVTVLEPFYRKINISWKEKVYNFNSVRVDFLQQVLVNGKPLNLEQAVYSSILAQHKAS